MEKHPWLNNLADSLLFVYHFKILVMFGFFKTDPRKKLEKAYAAKLEEARDAQRGGDIKRFAQLTAEAEAIVKQIEALPNGKTPLMLI